MGRLCGCRLAGDLGLSQLKNVTEEIIWCGQVLFF
jgi:hypothetical protein